MPNPRKSLKNLSLQGSPNLRRSKSYLPAKRSAKYADLEKLYVSLKTRRAELSAQLEREGMILTVERFSGGKLYMARIVNPAAKLLQKTEDQLIALAKLLTSDTDESQASERKKLSPLDELNRLLDSKEPSVQ